MFDMAWACFLWSYISAGLTQATYQNYHYDFTTITTTTTTTTTTAAAANNNNNNNNNNIIIIIIF